MSFFLLLLLLFSTPNIILFSIYKFVAAPIFSRLKTRQFCYNLMLEVFKWNVNCFFRLILHIKIFSGNYLIFKLNVEQIPHNAPVVFISWAAIHKRSRVMNNWLKRNVFAQLMLDSWNNHIFNDIKKRLQDSAMKLVLAERNGEAFNSQLVIGVRESYGLFISLSIMTSLSAILMHLVTLF